MKPKPVFEARDMDKILKHSFREIENRPDRLSLPLLDHIRALNVVDDMYPDRLKRNIRTRNKLIHECTLFLANHHKLIKKGK